MYERDAQADCLHDAHPYALVADDIILPGHAAEAFGNPAGQAVRAFCFQLQMELAVDFFEGDIGVHQPGVEAHGLKYGARFGEFVVDVAGDFFEDVAAGDEAGDAAVFVHHDGDMNFILLEAHEEAVERHAFGHINRRQGGGGQRMGGVEQKTADIQEAGDFVELAVVED